MIKFLVSQVVITSLVLGTMKKHGIIKYAPNSLLSIRIQLNRIPSLQAPVFSLILIPIMGYNMYVTVLSGATKSVSIMQKSNSSTSGPYYSWLSPLWETRHLHLSYQQSFPLYVAKLCQDWSWVVYLSSVDGSSNVALWCRIEPAAVRDDLSRKVLLTAVSILTTHLPYTSSLVIYLVKPLKASLGWVSKVMLWRSAGMLYK